MPTKEGDTMKDLATIFLEEIEEGASAADAIRAAYDELMYQVTALMDVAKEFIDK